MLEKRTILNKYIAYFLIILLLFTCNGSADKGEEERDYRQEMRDFVINLSTYARTIDNDFIVIPQNGQELLTSNGLSTGTIVSSYIDAIDGIGREDLFYGYEKDNEPTPPEARDSMIEFLNLAKQNGIEVLIIDYCSDHSNMDYSYAQNAAKGYISFAADRRELDTIPSYPSEPYGYNEENPEDTVTLNGAKNFLYLLNNAENYSTRTEFIGAVQNTNYDLIITDIFHYEDINTEEFTLSEITKLKIKKDGTSRLVIAYMSIGEAEDYRYYWKRTWNSNPPSWMEKENPHWEGNYKVRYWEKEWQNIIYGNDSSYLKKILDAGFDGVYLDLIDAYEYFEEK